MTGVHDQDHQPVIVDRVQDPVVTCHPDPQNSVHSREHLRARGPRVFGQRFRRGLDAFDYGPVELSQRPQSFGANSSAYRRTSRPEAEFRPDLLGRYRLRARLDLGQRLARRLRIREVFQQLAELLRSQALQFRREFGWDDRSEPLAALREIDDLAARSRMRRSVTWPGTSSSGISLTSPLYADGPAPTANCRGKPGRMPVRQGPPTLGLCTSRVGGTNGYGSLGGRAIFDKSHYSHDSSAHRLAIEATYSRLG